MVETVCPRCHQPLRAQKYGDYEECPHCGNDFFNIDPSVVVPRGSCKGFFIIRMLFLVIFLLLIVPCVIAGLAVNPGFFAASGFPLLCALACLSENTSRMLIGCIIGIIVTGGASFAAGMFFMHDVTNAGVLMVGGAVAGLAVGFSFTELLRASSLFGERCPFCNRRGIRGYGDGVFCRHCGHKPYIKPESRQLVSSLQSRNCIGPRIGCWIFLLIGIGLFCLIPFLNTEYIPFLAGNDFSGLKACAVLFGFLFILLAAQQKRRFKCKRCRTPWSLIKLDEAETGSTGPYIQFDRNNGPTGPRHELHVYQNVSGRTIYGCRCCGHLETRKWTRKDRLDK